MPFDLPSTSRSSPYLVMREFLFLGSRAGQRPGMVTVERERQFGRPRKEGDSDVGA